MVKAYIAGTCDTKGVELRYIKGLIEAVGLETCLVDLGTGKGDGGPVDVQRRKWQPTTWKVRGQCCSAMTVAAQ